MSFFNRHKHQWVEVSRTFNEPSNTLERMKGSGPDALNTMSRLAFGFTVIEHRCSECGNIDFATVLGRTA